MRRKLRDSGAAVNPRGRHVAGPGRYDDVVADVFAVPARERMTAAKPAASIEATRMPILASS